MIIFSSIIHDYFSTVRDNRFFNRAPANILEELDPDLLKTVGTIRLRDKVMRRMTAGNYYGNFVVLSLSAAIC